MITFENLLTVEKDGLFTITINRPDKLNALNKQTIAEIGHAIAFAEKNPDVRVMIITGSGSKAFVAGADISEFSSFNESQGAHLARHGQEVFASIEHCSKPVIAAVNGFALGGGCELAMACHLRVASTNAKFGQPEVKLGLIPGYGGTQRLPMLIGKTKALEFLMTADMINAQDAFMMGLVNYVTEPDQLMAKCEELASKIKQQAPLAVAGIIRCVNGYYDKKNRNFETEIKEFGKCFVTDDFIEGANAFLEKRKPDFKGN